MVRNASYKQGLTASGVDKLSDVAVNTFQMFLLDRRTGGLDVEDDVEVYFAERLRHDSTLLLLPLRGVGYSRMLLPRTLVVASGCYPGLIAA